MRSRYFYQMQSICGMGNTTGSSCPPAVLQTQQKFHEQVRQVSTLNICLIFGTFTFIFIYILLHFYVSYVFILSISFTLPHFFILHCLLFISYYIRSLCYIEVILIYLISGVCRKPDTLKQKNAFPPNFIHSLDSCHMMLTSLHCEQAGITFMSVHDCFWTHPCSVEIMSKVRNIESQELIYHLRHLLLKHRRNNAFPDLSGTIHRASL